MAFLHEDESFPYLVVETQRAFDMPEEYVVKNYFIYIAIKGIVARNPLVVFKGGTSLSKCHGVIERFSEDIDLGMETPKPTEGQRRRMKRATIETVEALRLSVSNIDNTRSRRAFNQFIVPLPTFTATSNSLIIETALMAPIYPTVERGLSSFIYRYCIQEGMTDVVENFDLAPFKLTVSSMEKTFVDKTFAICDYYLSGDILARRSRHIYDLYKLLPEVKLDSQMTDLFKQVRLDRQGSPNCPSAQEDVNLPSLLKTIRDTDVYKSDYENVTSPLLFETVSYETAITARGPIIEFLS